MSKMTSLPKQHDDVYAKYRMYKVEKILIHLSYLLYLKNIAITAQRQLDGQHLLFGEYLLS